MTISRTGVQKALAALFVGAALFVVFAPKASAESYYYPVQGNTQSLQQLIVYLNTLLAQLETLQNQYENRYGQPYVPGFQYGPYTYTYTVPVRNRFIDYDVEVETERVRNIDGDEATFYGDVDLDDADYAYVWFEYGQRGDIDEETDKERVTRDTSFNERVDDLEEDERYYVRAVAEDPAGYRTYGRLIAFDADDDGDSSSRDDDEPEATTDDAEDVEDDRAELHGEVDMNDFSNGLVFFVYGEDEDAVEDVADEDEYRDIDEDGRDLQKFVVDSDLDGGSSYWGTVSGLRDNTDHYFRICVEYEDEDDDPTLECGQVEHFETD